SSTHPGLSAARNPRVWCHSGMFPFRYRNPPPSTHAETPQSRACARRYLKAAEQRCRSPFRTYIPVLLQARGYKPSSGPQYRLRVSLSSKKPFYSNRYRSWESNKFERPETRQGQPRPGHAARIRAIRPAHDNLQFVKTVHKSKVRPLNGQDEFL